MSIEDKATGIFRIQPGFEPSVNFFFLNNLYHGRFNQDFDDKRKITANPMFTDAGAVPDGIEMLKNYGLLESSPAKNASFLLPVHATFDFLGTHINRESKISLGAFQ